MRKISRLKIAILFLFTFTLLGIPILATAQIFGGQQSATPPQDQGQLKISDPFEHSNRNIFKFNDRVYFGIVKPVAVAYLKLPKPFRKVIGNGFDNLEIPSHFVNFVLQGEPRKAGNEMSRFILNSTVGIGGMFDVAANACGIQGDDADFGQTLGKWSVGPGPYLVVPVLGPYNERDLFGFAVDSAMDPLVWVPGPFWITIPPDFVKYVNKAADHVGEYEALKKAALDPYVAMRDGYMQHRASVISNR